MNEHQISELAPASGPTAQYIEQSKSMMEQLATAQIQARYTVALRNRRDIETARQEMMKECSRPSFCMPDEKKNGSSVAIYRVPRAGTNIEGVTIRFAEMAARAWRNLAIDITPLGEDETQRIYQVTCTDFETNNVATEIVNVPKTVERSRIKDTDTVISERMNSYGKKVFTIIGTEDDIAMSRNARISKARRNLILQFIPGWLVEECIDQIRTTAAKKDAEDPDAAKRKVFDAFAGVGITAQMLTEFIGHGGPLSPAELDNLRGYYGALREGYTTWAEIAASKSEDQDDDQAKQVDELLAKSGRTPAQARKLKSQYIGRGPELLKFLQDEAAKKADTGAATETQQVQTQPAVGKPLTANPVSAPHGGPVETEVPADLKEAAGQQVAAEAQKANHSAPPPISGDWD